MSRKKSNAVLGIQGFLVGGIIGSAVAMLYAPKSGEATRYDIKKYTRLARFKKRKLVTDAKQQSNELLRRAEEILNRSKEFATGKYSGTIDNFEKEFSSLKAGVNAAIDAYKNYQLKNSDKMVDEIFIDFNDPSLKNLNEESLPKREGMGRRTD